MTIFMGAGGGLPPDFETVSSRAEAAARNERQACALYWHSIEEFEARAGELSKAARCSLVAFLTGRPWNGSYLQGAEHASSGREYWHRGCPIMRWERPAEGLLRVGCPYPRSTALRIFIALPVMGWGFEFGRLADAPEGAPYHARHAIFYTNAKGAWDRVPAGLDDGLLVRLRRPGAALCR